MPKSLMALKALRSTGFSDVEAHSIADILQHSQVHPHTYDGERWKDFLSENGFSDPLADAVVETLRNCFLTERFSTAYQRVALKTKLVRGGWPAQKAEHFLNSIDHCVVTATDGSIRANINFSPGAGRVVMCDFSFLKPPEMQKERRAIIISARSNDSSGRCTVVPVSMSPSRTANIHHHEFPAGRYSFFHHQNPVWAVCDHVYTVALSRLWKINIARKPELPSISADDLAKVRRLAGAFIGVVG